MEFLKKLFGNKKNNVNSEQSKQAMEGFYIIRHEYGEEQAKELFKKANVGDVNAQLEIARCFMNAAEQPYALHWFEKAAEAGNSYALHELTYFYEGCYVGIEANPTKAEITRNRALGTNNPEEFLKLASQYYTGHGVAMDKIKSFQYYMNAAELGNSEGCAEVGLCYLNGEGVQQNNSKAFMWLSKSKDGKYGYYHLAQCYLQGIGTTKDEEKAVVCLEKAVNCKCLELNQARKQLADLYAKGYGGANASIKLEKLDVDIKKSDDLIDELANLIL